MGTKVLRKIEFKAIPDRPGLYQYELEPPVNCFPGQWHLVEWGIYKGRLTDGSVLETKTEDAFAAKVLVYMHRAFMNCPNGKGDELFWIGVSRTRLIQDDLISNKPLKKRLITILIDRLREEGLLDVVQDGTDEVLFPTTKLIMAMIKDRRPMVKQESTMTEIREETRNRRAAEAAT